MALQDDNVELRQSAIESLMYLSDTDHAGGEPTFFVEPLKFTTPEVIEAVLKALRDEDANVRSSAVCILRRIENQIPDIVSLLVDALADPVPEVRREASAVLRRLRQVTPKGVAALFVGLQNQDEEVKSNSWEGLSDLSFEGREWSRFNTTEGLRIADALHEMLLSVRNLDNATKSEVQRVVWPALWAVAAHVNGE